ncbi:SCO family protein [Salinilacihabitans rarus]|uniref:SCO family protein n=1 Tax=Salinilacihabitans rarus TaxID=2961596 RepID=UPI0020C8A764|nr:SCO family protein [Salinilacihabitans rarus]
MTHTPSGPDRRTVLRAAGAAAIGASLAGCSQANVFGSEDDGVVLPPPENYEKVADVDLPHPAYGESLPEATVPAPLHDRTVTTTEFVGERHAMFTFIFTSCTTVCPGLTATLRRVQADATEEGYADEVAFLPVTFDPEYDTAAVLEEYGEDHGVDFEAGNWYFLRPETPADARDVVEDTFGVAFERADDADDEMDDGEMDHDEMGHDRHFVHSSLILLVNEDGLVERAYTGGPPGANTVIEDARAVVEGW